MSSSVASSMFQNGNRLSVYSGYSVTALLDSSSLSKCILHQLLISPLCRKINAELLASTGGMCLDPVYLGLGSLPGITQDKLKKLHLGFSDSAVNDLATYAYVVECGSGKIGQDTNMPPDAITRFFQNNVSMNCHLTWITPRFNKDTLPSLGLKARRISLFEPTLVIQNESTTDSLTPTMRVLSTLYPYISQFLPIRFKEIEDSDLALAARLNAEICGPSKPASFYPECDTLERLGYSDCMQIIGRDDRI